MTEERTGVRLNKFLAERLGISRREADDLIKAGEITLNGETAVIGSRVDKSDKVCYNSRELPSKATFVYYLFNKPVGYVCSRHRQGEVPTIYELLPENMQRLKNVGRLDRTSSGVLLLTNDGNLGFQLTHPKFVKQKVYEVTIHQPLTPEDRKRITEDGVEISDGLSRFDIADNLSPSLEDTPLRQQKLQRAKKRRALQDAKDAAAKLITHPDDAAAVEQAAAAKRIIDNDNSGPDGFHLIVTLTEGRNRQIRRTFAALGYNVLTLHRIRFGKYELGDLKPGEYRPVENLYVDDLAATQASDPGSNSHSNSSSSSKSGTNASTSSNSGVSASDSDSVSASASSVSAPSTSNPTATAPDTSTSDSITSTSNTSTGTAATPDTPTSASPITETSDVAGSTSEKSSNTADNKSSDASDSTGA